MLTSHSSTLIFSYSRGSKSLFPPRRSAATTPATVTTSSQNRPPRVASGLSPSLLVAHAGENLVSLWGTVAALDRGTATTVPCDLDVGGETQIPPDQTQLASSPLQRYKNDRVLPLVVQLIVYVPRAAGCSPGVSSFSRDPSLRLWVSSSLSKQHSQKANLLKPILREFSLEVYATGCSLLYFSSSPGKRMRPIIVVGESPWSSTFSCSPPPFQK
ncbi:hypothetical protein VIGAN_09132400 [Vigna angularis var. angularis]|uniref:Uncharacterized protein n=1 Tax=Vigna angularis var. angularis TaxID=157739 RepID=A0A0S3SY15_PHAAN|nr:hypothetical protein VIGAN_09132400 [Vigna angularis var. angularis]